MADTNPNSRLEAFCDGVFAIALTLLIIDIKIPETIPIDNNAALWQALKHIAPSLYAFLLSFGIIIIAWHNHHATLKLVDKSSSAFIYANAVLLMTIVFIPFPTHLLGEYLFTNHAVPAVVLFCAVNLVQPIGWILIGHTALNPKNRLTKTEKHTWIMRQNTKNGYYSIIIYGICTIAAFWFPLATAAAISIIWIIWLIYGLKIKAE